MISNYPIEISLSKAKMMLVLTGSIIFVTVGIWFVVNPTKFISIIMRSTTIISIVGMACILFFGLIGFLIFKKMGDKKPGLIVSEKGLLDNSSGISHGFIPWSDVVKIEETKIRSQKFINIIVRNPEEYINKQKIFFHKKIVRVNYKLFGSVIQISSNSIKYNFSDLKQLLIKTFEEYKSGINKSI